jgi:DNA-binding response OmpR family regulator
MRAVIGAASWFGVQIEHDLRQGGMLVTTADSGEEVLELLPMLGRAAIILDMDAAEEDWQSLLARARKLRPNAPVIALCESHRLEDEIQALSKGADDVFTGRMQAEEVLARVVRVATRRAGFASSVLHLGPLEIDTYNQRVCWHGHPIALTPSQYHILELLTLRAGCFVSNDEVMDLLYGAEVLVEPQAVRVFVSHIRRRLREAGAADVSISGVARMGFQLSVAGYDGQATSTPKDWSAALPKAA